MFVYVCGLVQYVYVCVCVFVYGLVQCTVHEKNHLRTFECSRKINSREVGLMQNIIKRMREIIAQYRARSSRNIVRDGDLRTYVPKKGLKVIINVQVLS